MAVRFHRFLMALAAGAVLLAVTPLAYALPASVGYGSNDVALKAPNDEERQLLALINADRAVEGLSAMDWDATMSAVAREHCQDMADHDYFEYVSQRLGPMEYRLHRAGVVGPDSRYAIFLTGDVDKLVGEMRKKKKPFHLKAGTNLGVGVVSKGLYPKQFYVTLISREKRFGLEKPFPTQPVYGRTYRLAGQLAAGLRDPRLIVTVPPGEIHETEIELSRDRKVDAPISFIKGRGRYSVEIVATGKLGPTVACLMQCYVGAREYPAPPKRSHGDEQSADLRLMEVQMFKMVNASRRDARLKALEYDERLARTARGHSEDMRDNGFFAHVSPTQGALSQRMLRAGIKALTFTENIAANRSLGAAQEGLMDSPGHRANILDKDATHVGIGIVRDDGGNLFVTQNYSRAFPKYDAKTVAADFLKDVNAARKKANLRQLKSDKPLADIARENSKAMVEVGRPGYEKARELLEKRKLRFKYIGMSVFKSNFPPASENIPDTLNKRYDSIGIGVAKTESKDGETTLWTTVLLGER